MSMSANIHNPTMAEAIPLRLSNDSLRLSGGTDDFINIFCPPHVAKHTAAAFNRAMQAVPAKGGFDYTTKAGVWHISIATTGHNLYQYQHDDIDVDAPGYMHGTAQSIIGAMDEIDELVAENICDECAYMDGLDNLTEIGRGKDMRMVCKDCLAEMSERELGLREMADDDKAHAQAERAAE